MSKIAQANSKINMVVGRLETLSEMNLLQKERFAKEIEMLNEAVDILNEIELAELKQRYKEAMSVPEI